MQTLHFEGFVNAFLVNNNVKSTWSTWCWHSGWQWFIRPDSEMAGVASCYFHPWSFPFSGYSFFFLRAFLSLGIFLFEKFEIISFFIYTNRWTNWKSLFKRLANAPFRLQHHLNQGTWSSSNHHPIFELRMLSLSLWKSSSFVNEIVLIIEFWLQSLTLLNTKRRELVGSIQLTPTLCIPTNWLA